MTLSQVSSTVVGVDGCKSGWFAFIKTQHNLEYLRVPSLSILQEKIADQKLADEVTILIDMPIGLPEPNAPSRECDRLARQHLPGRSASIFPVPCRAALYAEDYQTACQINAHHLGKRLPIQTWNITPKIRELDELLDINQNMNFHYYESHPELLFAGLAGKPMLYAKATPQGSAERLNYLADWAKADFPMLQKALAETPKKLAKADDIIDAFILLYAASQPKIRWQSLPAAEDRDSRGKLRQIVFVPKR